VRRVRIPLSLAGALLLALSVGVSPALAQLNTQHIKGPTGLKSGSQPPPRVYVIGPLIWVYKTDTVKNADGDKIALGDADITVGAYGAGALVVTTKKILGGNYSFSALFPAFMQNGLQGTEIDKSSGLGITDTQVSPITLGWHFKRADAIAGYNIFVPTGRYSDGADNNTGLGMWGHELLFGTTLYLDEARQYHASALFTFDFQSKKEDSETKVGNAMNIEGGVGADFLQGGLSAGLAYYASFKLTDDEILGFPNINVLGKNKAFALGPEVSLALVRKGSVFGSLKVNYQWEVYARTATQGSAFTIMTTFLVPPIKLPGTK
jgi:hypothetical protein